MVWGLSRSVPKGAVVEFLGSCPPPPQWSRMIGENTWSSVVGENFARVRLSDGMWRVVKIISRRWNEGVRYESDLRLYGESDVWVPAALGDSGDCEDIALGKWRELAWRGFHPGCMSLSTCLTRDPRRPGHAVLLVHDERATLVLDNRVHAVLPIEKTQYRYVATSVPGRERWAYVSYKKALTLMGLMSMSRGS